MFLVINDKADVESAITSLVRIIAKVYCILKEIKLGRNSLIAYSCIAIT